MDNSLNLLLEFLREERAAFAEYLKEDDYYHEDDDSSYDEGYAAYQERELEWANEQVDGIIDRTAANGLLSKSDAATVKDFIEDEGLLEDYLENAGEDIEVEEQILAYIEGVFK